MSTNASFWSPSQYERYKDERARPGLDLIALVRPRAGMRAIDLGCGTGELTRELHAALGAAETIGVDSSETMLAKSAAFAGGGLRFERATIEEAAARGATFDLVFSNAALQWVDDHHALFLRLAAMVAPEGQIAIQIPSNDDHASHVVANEVAREAPFADALGGHTRVVPNLKIDEYAALLDRAGFREQHVRTQVYAHHLASRDDVVEWMRGSLLTDFQRRMPAEMFPRFLERYREKLRERLEDARPFFFPFKRTLMWGMR